MSRAIPLAFAMALSACQLLPVSSGLTCNGVRQDVCELAFEHVQLVMGTRGGETLTAVAVGPTQFTGLSA